MELEGSKIDSINQYSVLSWSYRHPPPPAKTPEKDFTSLYDYYPNFFVSTLLAVSTNIKCAKVRYTWCPRGINSMQPQSDLPCFLQCSLTQENLFVFLYQLSQRNSSGLTSSLFPPGASIPTFIYFLNWTPLIWRVAMQTENTCLYIISWK